LNHFINHLSLSNSFFPSLIFLITFKHYRLYRADKFGPAFADSVTSSFSSPHSNIHKSAQSGYEKEAATYERGRPDYSIIAIEYLISHLPIHANMTIVELGAGTGKFTRLLHSIIRDSYPALAPTIRIIATEPVQAMRQQFSKILPDIQILNAPAENLPFGNNSVDIVIAAQAFHWFDPIQTCLEMMRILKKSTGKLALIWNRRDGTAGTLHGDVSALMDEYEENDELKTPRYRHGSWKRVFQYPQCGFRWPLVEKNFEYVQRGGKQMIIDRAMSVSFIAALAKEEKDIFRKKLDAIVDKYSKNNPSYDYHIVYLTEVFTTNVLS